MLIGVLGIVIVQVVASLEGGGVLQVQLDIVAQPDAARDVGACGNGNGTAACGGAGVNGRLDLRGTKRFAVGNGAVIKNICVHR